MFYRPIVFVFSALILATTFTTTGARAANLVIEYGGGAICSAKRAWACLIFSTGFSDNASPH